MDTVSMAAETEDVVLVRLDGIERHLTEMHQDLHELMSTGVGSMTPPGYYGGQSWQERCRAVFHYYHQAENVESPLWQAIRADGWAPTGAADFTFDWQDVSLVGRTAVNWLGQQRVYCYRAGEPDEVVATDVV